jgi:hypothetical protein
LLHVVDRHRGDLPAGAQMLAAQIKRAEQRRRVRAAALPGLGGGYRVTRPQRRARKSA